MRPLARKRIRRKKQAGKHTTDGKQRRHTRGAPGLPGRTPPFSTATSPPSPGMVLTSTVVRPRRAVPAPRFSRCVGDISLEWIDSAAAFLVSHEGTIQNPELENHCHDACLLMPDPSPHRPSFIRDPSENMQSAPRTRPWISPAEPHQPFSMAQARVKHNRKSPMPPKWPFSLGDPPTVWYEERTIHSREDRESIPGGWCEIPELHHLGSMNLCPTCLRSFFRHAQRTTTKSSAGLFRSGALRPRHQH